MTGRGQDLQQGMHANAQRDGVGPSALLIAQRQHASWSHGVVASRPGPSGRTSLVQRTASDARSWEDVTQVS
jgi:hypothetical protein